MSTTDNDREEARDARDADNTRYRRINGQLYDADDAPDPQDA